MAVVIVVSMSCSPSVYAGEAVSYPDIWGRDLQSYSQLRRDFSSWNSDRVSGGVDAYFTDDGDVAIPLNIKRQWLTSSTPETEYYLLFFSGNILERPKKTPFGWRSAKWSLRIYLGEGKVVTSSNTSIDCLDILDPYSFIRQPGGMQKLPMHFLLKAHFPIEREVEIGGSGCNPPLPVHAPKEAIKALSVHFLPLADGSFLAWDLDRGPEIIRFGMKWNTPYRPHHITLMGGDEFHNIVGGSENPIDRQKNIVDYLSNRKE